MASFTKLQRWGSDGPALLLTATLGATIVLALRAVTPELPHFVRDREVTLMLEAAQPAPAAPPSPPQPTPQKRHVAQLRPEPTADPLPVAPTPAPADVAPVATVDAAQPPAPSQVEQADLDARYAAELRADIDHRTAPPDTALYRLRHPFGEVRVRFVVLRSGTPQEAGVARSSGSALLDEQAVRIVASGQYPPMPANVFAGENRHVFFVTIEFRPSPRY